MAAAARHAGLVVEVANAGDQDVGCTLRSPCIVTRGAALGAVRLMIKPALHHITHRLEDAADTPAAR